MCMKHGLAGVFLLAFSQLGYSQTGGDNTFAFLNVVSSARVASVGGNLISVKDNDLSLGMYNPALLNKSMHNTVSSSYVNYFSDINFGFVNYARHYDSIGTFSASVSYLNYGKFLETTDNGEIINEFTCSDYTLTLGYARQIDTSFSVGVNLKTLYSSYWQYFAWGLALDVGATYHRPDIGFTASALLKNFGFQLQSYTDSNREKLPFEVQVGVSQKLKHAPFRFSLGIENLQKWDLSYVDPTIQPEIDPATGDEIPVPAPGFFNKMFRHVVIGTELVTKNFTVGGGFNFRRRAELSYSEKPGMVGFSFGAGIKIKKIQINYALSSYHLAAKSNHITVAVNLDQFKN